jgi:hypothetical protein
MSMCECVTWAREFTGPFLTDHHPNCPEFDMAKDAAGIIRDLVHAMEAWGHEEDGIPDDCWEAYVKGKLSIGEEARRDAT